MKASSVRIRLLIVPTQKRISRMSLSSSFFLPWMIWLSVVFENASTIVSGGCGGCAAGMFTVSCSGCVVGCDAGMASVVVALAGAVVGDAVAGPGLCAAWSNSKKRNKLVKTTPHIM